MTIRDRVLERAAVYQAWKATIGASRVMTTFVDEYVQPVKGERLLDIGCGTGDVALSLPGVKYVGVDLNGDYIQAARRRALPNAEFLSASVEDLAALGLGQFDCAIAVGVLHHLPDDVIETMVDSLGKLLAPEGRLVTLDGVWAPDSSTVSRVLTALDRGRFVRDAAGYRRVVAPVLPNITIEVRHDLLRIPYSHCIMRCTR